MGTRDQRVDAYIEKSAEFAQPILRHLREVVHEGCPEVEEEIKWGMPFFTYNGMFCHMAAFKQHCALGFWNGRRIFPAAQEKSKEAMGNFGRITSLRDLPPRRALLGHVKAARRFHDELISRPKPSSRPREKKELVVPAYFAAALKKNKKALAAFEAFSYSHRKEYVEWVGEAKSDETRERRLATTLEWLAEGKSRNWKYERR